MDTDPYVPPRRRASGPARRRAQPQARPGAAVALAAAALAVAGSTGVAAAHEDKSAPPRVEEIVVLGRSESLVGIADAASTGRVGQAEIGRVPYLRPGEVLERIPGLIATQHSGTGKANQFFLRGFNLDHGTDFSTSLEGVPLNLPTHGHGQGYLDVNLLIPELVEVLEFRKGPYHADVGDFSSAGTSRIEYVDRLERPFLQATFGEFDFYRVVGGGSHALGPGELLVGGDFQFYDGPWTLDENLEKYNGILKWTWGDEERGVSLFGSAYSADWSSTDQIALRAFSDGSIGRFDNLDDDLGGNTSRYTASASLWNGATNQTRFRGYASFYDFDLWSNFTYFLDDPVNGDEFQQMDERTILGFDFAQDYEHDLGPLHLHHTAGAQVRHDAISDVGLFKSAARERLSTVREDEVEVTSVGLYWNASSKLTDWMRAYVGVRGDLYWFEVDAISNPENGGNESDGIVNPKVGVVLGPWADTELYLNYGGGFHSNDARGTTIRVDPVSGDPVDRVDPLVATQGAEIGARTTWVPGLQSTLAVWWLDLDSELLFIGDAGNTEATRPSQRYGVEIANYWRPLDWLTLDADVTFTESEFTDDDPAGDDIPGAIETTVAAGAAVDLDYGLFGSLRVRHFGDRPLIEDGSVKSGSTTLVNLQAGWSLNDFSWAFWSEWVDLTLKLDVLNLLDSKDDDITYFYASRLAGEPAEGVEDKHFHPVEPRMVRGSVVMSF